MSFDDESTRSHHLSDDRRHDQSPQYPRYVRHLAVAYVLSRLVGPLGFLLLSLVAVVLWLRRGLSVDAWVFGIAAAALACPLLCAAFRGWYRSWGRRRWPEADLESPA